MSRFGIVIPGLESVDPEVAALLAELKEREGRVSNMALALAVSSTALKSFVNFKSAVDTGELGETDRQKIALRLAQLHRADYCLATQTANARALGWSEELILACRTGEVKDPSDRALFAFVEQVAALRGHVEDCLIDDLKNNGYSESQIVELVTHVVYNTFCNYMSTFTRPPIGYRPADPLQE